MALDPATGAIVPDQANNPFMHTMAAPAVGAPGPGAAPPNPALWHGLPSQGLLQMLLRAQQTDPARFAQFMQQPMAAKFGMTADNIGDMQSKQAARSAAFAAAGMPQHHPMMAPTGMMPPTGMTPPVAMPPTIAPAAPLAPQHQMGWRSMLPQGGM